jgi:glycosyltransferase involved in cell wall biosynthesis
MKAPLFSVVVPLYNKGPHVARCLDSILSQAGPEFEVVVVDDGSSDGSLETAQVYAAKDGRVRVLRRDRPGPGGYAARNLGSREARGEWIAFLDADDEWMPNFLAELERLAARFPEAGCLCGSYIIRDEGERDALNPFAARREGTEASIVGVVQFIREAAAKRWPMHTSSTAIRREVLLADGGFPEGKSERGGDRDTWLRAVLRTPLAWTPFVGAIYHMDSVNMVTRTTTHQADPVLARTIRAFLGTKGSGALGLRLRLALMKLYNVTHDSYFRQQRRAGVLRLSDLSCLYLAASPLYCLRVAIMALVPLPEDKRRPSTRAGS